jgi:hypothetical protein
MEKQIGRWSYWLGIACLLIGAVLRAASAFGLLTVPTTAPGRAISYWSFYHGSALLFITSIASMCYSWLANQKP